MRRMAFAVTVGILLALPAPALAFGGDHTEFTGACEFTEGAIRYPDEGLRTEARKLLIDVRAKGTCSGQLDGRQITDVPFKFHARGRDKFSCNPGESADDLRGILDIEGRSNNLAGYLSFTTTAVVANPGGPVFEGRDGGELTGNLDAMPPPDAALQCMTKRGLRKIPFQAQLTGDIAG